MTTGLAGWRVARWSYPLDPGCKTLLMAASFSGLSVDEYASRMTEELRTAHRSCCRRCSGYGQRNAVMTTGQMP